MHIARFPVNPVSLLHLITNKLRANKSLCELHPCADRCTNPFNSTHTNLTWGILNGLVIMGVLMVRLSFFSFTEEICTLVIAEAFPEDGGLFCCRVSNPYGSMNSTAHLTVTAGESKSWDTAM